MKKTYEKPTLVKVGNLPLVTAGIFNWIGNGHDNGHGNGNGNGFLVSLEI
jgi:hypothetical protein